MFLIAKYIKGEVDTLGVPTSLFTVNHFTFIYLK